MREATSRADSEGTASGGGCCDFFTQPPHNINYIRLRLGSELNPGNRSSANVPSWTDFPTESSEPGFQFLLQAVLRVLRTEKFARDIPVSHESESLLRASRRTFSISGSICFSICLSSAISICCVSAFFRADRLTFFLFDLCFPFLQSSAL